MLIFFKTENYYIEVETVLIYFSIIYIFIYFFLETNITFPMVLINIILNTLNSIFLAELILEFAFILDINEGLQRGPESESMEPCKERPRVSLIVRMLLPCSASPTIAV